MGSIECEHVGLYPPLVTGAHTRTLMTSSACTVSSIVAGASTGAGFALPLSPLASRICTFLLWSRNCTTACVVVIARNLVSTSLVMVSARGTTSVGRVALGLSRMYEGEKFSPLMRSTVLISTSSPW